MTIFSPKHTSSLMLSSVMPHLRQIILWLVIAVAVLLGSFFGTLRVIDRFFPGVGYDVARFPRVQRGQSLDFQNNNRGALIDGWANSEPWGVWSEGDRAQLGFLLVSVLPERTKLLIGCRAFITPANPEQRIEFWAQNIKLADVTLRENISTIAVPLGELRFRAGSPLIIELRMPSARSPKQLALSQDPRKLAIGLERARFEEEGVSR
ncbi:hypothetical protein ACVIHI_009015 [Bradyrhizobium sp. USDA 4524]|uniref:DUF7024 domain-containing protein n=1 Tax=unclassified Bradyrhizobium TaxID=2631580 RepID=UPI00209CB091|nr:MULTISPECIES: hypothetical protein [unclassified Bradyrhizobium]MCP1845519.1 hypothetical protein [Bradyrhizobium sp. USDA 4538]MCP1907159.1 hypothetical protein [Bradyrhizobium sp. USDA 4537]MCP1985635.1 hypothetical protein [Bradyrhizobium sp. USDA 4539]